MNSASISAVARDCFRYFFESADPHTGLIPDRLDGQGKVISPASLAVTGMGLCALIAGAKRGWIARAAATARVLTTLRFFAWHAQRHHGFFFHFLDLPSGNRAWNCEVSSIDSTILFLGALFCGAYFDLDTPKEREIRELSAEIFDRANWNAFCGGQEAVSIAFTPERGFSKHAWRGYSEGILLAVLGLGATRHPLAPQSYDAWLQTYRKKRVYGVQLAYCRPLFTHLFPHLWLDLRGKRDAWMRQNRLDYIENTRRAVQMQIEWARRRGNPQKWGVSACEAPQNRGSYRARGVPFGRFEGLFSPPVCLASLPFAPEEAQLAWEFWTRNYPQLVGNWGVRGAIEPQSGWIGSFMGLDQGMLLLMLENADSGLFWELSRQIEPLERGLMRAGFEEIGQ